jgi:hypothetical protein
MLETEENKFRLDAKRLREGLSAFKFLLQVCSRGVATTHSVPVSNVFVLWTL